MRIPISTAPRGYAVKVSTSAVGQPVALKIKLDTRTKSTSFDATSWSFDMSEPTMDAN